MLKFKMTTVPSSMSLTVGFITVITVLGSASTVVAQPISVDLEPVADHTIYSDFPDASAFYQVIWGIDNRRRSLMKWDLPADLAGKTVLKAELEMEIERVGDPGTEIEIRLMTQDWTDNTSGAGQNPCVVGATWNDYDCGNPWPGGAGALGDTDPNIAIPMTSWRTKIRDPNDPSMFISVSDPNVTTVAPISPFTHNNLGDFALWDIKSIVQQWADGTPNFGLLFHDASMQGEAGFWSIDHDAQANLSNGPDAIPPMLRLEYGARCDFDASGACGLADVNLMFKQGDLVTGVPVSPGNQFDLDTDNDIDGDDITEWLSLTGTTNGYSSPMLRGDTDDLDNMSPMDRTVDITDFQNFLIGFTGAGSQWEVGNFDGNGVVDITDFSNHFLVGFAAASGGTYGPGSAIPEPSTVLLLGLGGLLLCYLGWGRVHSSLRFKD